MLPSPFRTVATDVVAPMPEIDIASVRSTVSFPSRSSATVRTLPSALTVSVSPARNDPSPFRISVTSVRLLFAAITMEWLSTVSATPFPSRSVPSVRTSPLADTVSVRPWITVPF